MMILNKNEIRDIMYSVGFRLFVADTDDVFEKDCSYVKLTLVQELGGYVVELAESKEDALNNLFEDSDVIENNRDAETLANRIVQYFN